MAAELQTYGDSAIVKDVQEQIEILTPVENLLMKNLRKSTATATVHQWQDDTLRTVSSAAAAEIQTHNPSALSTPTLRTNLIEHVYLAGSVSEAQDKVKHFSGVNEYERQVTKVMMDWSNAAEFDLLRSSLISGVSGTAPRMNGVIRTLSTNVTAQTSGTVFSESILIGLLKMTWDNSNGESATDILVGSNLKSRISAFTTGLTKNVLSSEKMAGQVVQSYESDYGTVNVHLHRYIQSSDSTSRIAGIRMDKFYVAYLVDGEAKLTEYAKTKTAKDFVVNGYLTLENRNEKCSFFSSGYLNTF